MKRLCAMKNEINKKDWTGYRLHDFLQYEITNNPEFDQYHALIYTRLIFITNKARWADEISVPSAHTAKQSFCCIKTYRQKIKDLERFGMIHIIKKSQNQSVAAVMTLKTKKLQKTLVAMYLTAAPGSSLYTPGSLPEAVAGESGGYSKLPHIKRNGRQAPVSGNEKSKRGAASPDGGPSAGQTSPPIPNPSEKYARYGLHNNILQALIDLFREQEVDRNLAVTILQASHHIDVVAAVTEDPSLDKDEVLKTIKILLEFLKANPSSEGNETIKALTLSPEEKRLLQDDSQERM